MLPLLVSLSALNGITTDAAARERRETATTFLYVQQYAMLRIYLSYPAGPTKL